ncbi:hemopexin repeat-containing protein [Fulvivirga maritima]|uniref:Tc toxin subunit A-related protein n=1 Tax=Fulvivirga maritima TaxID=2904247 RepID=UPI001F2CDB2E|nr:hemopexin repeat-containing protein [Fulvivirga maritima]UII27014.1 hemopexin repeat-containing protein [Fulvivirga maritima]
MDNFPDYAELFGALDFKKGDEARTVYSPAAYLADLLQLMDDEFADDELNERRSDIRGILLDSENTYTLIPYLGIVNEILENKLLNGNNSISNLEEVYSELLPNTKYPFNMPFNLAEEEIKLYLQYLGISTEELHKLFATKEQLDDETVAREYLGLSLEDWAIITRANGITDEQMKEYFGYGSNISNDDFKNDLSQVNKFIESTGVTSQERRELIKQKLSEAEIQEKLAIQFYINNVNQDYALFNESEDVIKSSSNSKLLTIWFDRVNKFIRLAKKAEINFTHLDTILRLCNKALLNTEALKVIASIKKLHETTELPIDEIVALIASINEVGHTEGEMPEDLFNRVFNNKYAEQDNQYIASGNGIVPHQFLKEGYTNMEYENDLFSEANYYFRKRLIHALAISELALEKIIQRLDDKEVNSELWLSSDKKIELLNLLYRFVKLSEVLDLTHEEVFTLFDLLEQDSSILEFNQHSTFLNERPSSQDCLNIFIEGSAEDRLWLVQSMHALAKWMITYDLHTDTLWHITTGMYTNAKAEMAAKDLTVAQLNAMLKAFEEVTLHPKAFEQGAIDERTAKIIYAHLNHVSNNTCKHKIKLLDTKEEEAHSIANNIIPSLSKVSTLDFKGLGIEEALLEKISRNLIYKGYTSPSGIVISEKLPEDIEEFQLETDFDFCLKEVFDIIHSLYIDTESKTPENEEVIFNVYPSDFRTLPLAEEKIQEIYDNLIFNHYIDEEGMVIFSNFFSYPANWQHFDVNTHIQEHASEIYRLLNNQLDEFQTKKVKLTTSTFNELPLTEVEIQDLLKNLTFNEYIDESGIIKNKERLLAEDFESLRLAIQFYPYRHKILKLINGTIESVRKQYLMLNKAKLATITDSIIAQWAYEDLQGNYLNGDELMPEAKTFFNDDDNKDKLILGYYFEANTGVVIFNRMQQIIKNSEKYQLTDKPLLDLKFYQNEIDEIWSILMDLNLITWSGHIPFNKIDYFLNSDHAISFSVNGFEDFNKEIFFMLQNVAKATRALHQEIVKVIISLAEAQDNLLWENLKAIFGIDIGSLKVISDVIFEGQDKKKAWLLPAMESTNGLGEITGLPNNKAYNKAFQRVRQYALLAKKLQMGEKETAIAFHDQDLAAKFPEALELPEGIEEFNLLLEGEELLYLFADDNNDHKYWTYRRSDYELVDRYGLQIDDPKSDNLLGKEEKEIIDRLRKDDDLRKTIKEDPIRHLFEKEGMVQVDAAFYDKMGNLYVISGGNYFVKMKVKNYWEEKENPFGLVDNDFEKISTIDAAYVDSNNRLYLFADSMYVRYSDFSDTAYIDEGYPKYIQEGWAEENAEVNWPEIFTEKVDAAFEGKDGNTYFFHRNQFVSSEDKTIRDIKNHWGKLKYDFKDIDKIDGAFTHEGVTYIFAGEAIFKYTDSLENEDTHVADGFPMSIKDYIPDLPLEFANGVDAAFKGADDIIYLVKGEYNVQLTSTDEGNFSVMPLFEKNWGALHNPLQESTDNAQVDAAMIGLDGYTYLFSGDMYYRYKTSDYTMVDPGYPRLIADDWEGLTQIDAAFVLDGKTYIFGEKSINGSSEYVYIRYSTKDYTQIDEADEEKDSYITPIGNLLDVEEIEVYPTLQESLKWWSLPQSAIDAGFQKADAILNAHDGSTYMFFSKSDPEIIEGYVIEFNHTHRWWSEPVKISEKWNDLPFNTIDAAVAGKDGKTYLFSGDEYVRLSDKEACHIDNGYPRKISKYWGKVKNNILENGHIDAAVVVESREMDEDADGDDIRKVESHTYLFSGNQFFRYEGNEYSTVEPGYPKPLSHLRYEPRFMNLSSKVEQVDATLADFRNVYIFEGKKCHVISDVKSIAYKSENPPEDYSKTNVSYKYPETAFNRESFVNTRALFTERGSAFGLKDQAWVKFSALEGNDIFETVDTPLVINDAPNAYKQDLDAILQGTDGNTYFFKGEKCYNSLLETEYNIDVQWGKPENNIKETDRIDAGFVGRDGKTYVFSGTQYYTYEGQNYLGVALENHPELIASHWGGINQVTYAYVINGKTYLFEKADLHGNFRMVVYKTDDYRLETPETQYVDLSYWAIPAAQQRAGFDQFDAILCLDDNLIFIKGRHFIRYHVEEKNWSHPKELSLLFPDLHFNNTTFKKIETAFWGADNNVYFFDECYFIVGTHHSDGSYSYTNLEEINHHWGLFANPFSNGVDTAFVYEGVTYLIAGNYFVRYSDNDYESVDMGYPKKVSESLMNEEPFLHIGEVLQCRLKHMKHDDTIKINAVIANKRNTYVLINDDLHVSSKTIENDFWFSRLSHTRNNISETGVIDATFTTDEHTYLFSGDQYIRYTGNRYDYVDIGYPKLIMESLKSDLGLGQNVELPSEFKYGIDAAFYTNSMLTIFKDENNWISSDGAVEAIQGKWGQIKNNFSKATPIDTAYTDEAGKLFVFKEDQFICYSDTSILFSADEDLPKFVDAGYPMLIEEHKAHLPVAFTSNLDSTFWFENRLFFAQGSQYLMYKPGMKACDNRFYPQEFKYRWGNWSDYLLMDIYLLAKFMKLSEQFSSSEETLSSLLYDRDGYTKEPYWALAEIFGFDKEEIRWVLRNNAFLSRTNEMEQDFQLEAIIRLYDILSTAERLKVDASMLYNAVWMELYSKQRTYDTAAQAANNIYRMLGSVDYNDNYKALFDEIERALNTIKRDALVPYAIANDAEVEDARALYEKLLIDVQTENETSTSRIKEATMAIQLFFHRYFIHLEEVDLNGNIDEARWHALKNQWEWMRNYRVWEANRKVFLYPENYIRPELRDEDMKTPAFETLEQDLMQGEITDKAVERVYKKYLDEFTEVSRLKIAGGYIFEDSDESNPDVASRRLVLLGRTKSDPMRYYYRFGTFLDGDYNADSWKAWKPLNINIDSEKVYPVYAFNRVFVFWPKIETIAADSLSTNIDNSNEIVNVTSESKVLYSVKVYFSYYDLNENWVQPQELKTVFETAIEEEELAAYLKNVDDGNIADNFYKGININELNLSNFTYQHDPLLSQKEIADVNLSIAFADTLGDTMHDNIVITCQYSTVRLKEEIIPNNANQLKMADKNKVTRSFILTPELYTQLIANPVAFGNSGKNVFTQLFDEGEIEEENMVALNTTSNSLDAPWFAFDHKGGSFLCKPDIKLLDPDSINTAATIDAAFHTNGVTYYFNGEKYYDDLDQAGTEISSTFKKWTIPMQYFRRVESAFYTHLGYSIIMDNESFTKVNSSTDSYNQITPPLVYDNNLYEIITKLKESLVENGSSVLLSVSLKENLKKLKVVAAYEYVLNGLNAFYNINRNYPMRYHFVVSDTNNVRSIYFLAKNDHGTWDLIYPENPSTITFVGDTERIHSKEWTAAFSHTVEVIDSNMQKHVNFQIGFQKNVMQAITQISSQEQNIQDPVTYIFSWTGTNTHKLNKEIMGAASHETGIKIFSEHEFMSVSVQDFKEDENHIILPELLAQLIDEWQTSTISLEKTIKVEKASDFHTTKNVHRETTIRYDGTNISTRSSETSIATSNEEDYFNNNATPITAESQIGSISTEIYTVEDKEWVKKNEEEIPVDHVDAAYIAANKLILINEDKYATYNLTDSGNIPDTINNEQAKWVDATASHIDAAFVWEDQVYLVEDDHYYVISTDAEPDDLGEARPIKGNWSNIPTSFVSGIEAALVKDNELTFYKGGQSITYGKGEEDNQLYLNSNVDYQIIRLTSSTAKDFNKLLFQKQIQGFLQLETQQINETPAFSYTNKDATTIKVKDANAVKSLPTSTHIDYHSANGLYYWEVFFHVPFLIAQSLNTDQKFEEAKEWYEHIYDPTAAQYFWKFLPFQSVDIDALIEPAKLLADEFGQNLFVMIEKVGKVLKKYDDEFLGISTFGDHNTDTLENLTDYLTNTTNYFGNVLSEVKKLITPNSKPESPEQQLLEILQLMQQLPENYTRMQTTVAQVQTYLSDPFDPHAIAQLRPIAYRKSIVMSYIDNLLDWGDMLFRQYSRESINEARMLYVLAYDLLGKRPENLGTLVLSDDSNYEQLFHNEDVSSGVDYDFLLELETADSTNDQYTSLTFAGTQHDSITNPYFFIPENSLFMDYWKRVEDRLFKIRNSLNILGEKQPLPLFQPPIDPMALVDAIAAGGSLSGALATMQASVPHYRFTYMLDKAKAYADKLAQFGADLLGAIEKKDAEELELLHNKQEAMILTLNTQIKKDQIKDAEFTIKNLEESKKSAQGQWEHYRRLLDEGLIGEEVTQIAMMSASTAIHSLIALSHITSGLSYVIPQVTAGPFSFGVTSGGQQFGKMLEKFGDSSDSLAEGLSMGGEIAGIYAQYKRSTEDWELQRDMAGSEIKQLDIQINGAKLQKAIAEQELRIHEKDIDNNKSIAQFMTDKFSGLQLYSWMSSKLSGLYYQTYKMAHDIAKQAEKAFVFETGSKETDIKFIGGTYWDSQKKGLMSGETLGHDLSRMEKAYMEQDSRGLEITKNISLLELDPIAYLQLKMKGQCMFRLTEELFDQDFPGHYNRQVKTISVAFDIGEGKTVNATLTQLNNKLVMEPDVKAVKYLLDAKGEQPLSIRTDWKVNQQIALSYVDEYTENNGMFELRFDDERYLPFEGTGAVSLWQLELHGKPGSYNLEELLDVTIKLRYTAENGGAAFANAVKGVLKPYKATSFVDLAYTFPEQWNDFMLGDSHTLELNFTRSMFPGLAGSKATGLILRYQYHDGGSAIFELNDELKLANNQYLEASNLQLARNGSTWKFTVKGDKSQIANVEMVITYQAKV